MLWIVPHAFVTMAMLFVGVRSMRSVGTAMSHDHLDEFDTWC